jgi:hypothetical protein
MSGVHFACGKTQIFKLVSLSPPWLSSEKQGGAKREHFTHNPEENLNSSMKSSANGHSLIR